MFKLMKMNFTNYFHAPELIVRYCLKY